MSKEREEQLVLAIELAGRGELSEASRLSAECDGALAGALCDLFSRLSERRAEEAELLSCVVHDLRSPLTAISGFAEAFIDGAIKDCDRERYLRTIKSEAERASLMVGELLDASRLENGVAKFKREPLDLCESARVALISFERAIESKRLSVSFECESDSMTVLADGAAVGRVIRNLIDNAVKFSKEGGALGLSLWREGGNILLSVFNEGEGVDKTEIDRIFDRFYTKRSQANRNGTGLGLYLARLIIEAQGGRVFAESQKGE
jgi:signal transduction histidine kinase